MAKNIDVAKIAPSIHDDDEKEQPVNYRGIKAMPFIIGNETFEKLGTVGSSANLAVYLSSVFNMTSVSATTFVNVFNGTTNFAPLVGAFLSDTYFGRYNSLAFASVASFLGMLVLTLTAAIPSLHPPECAAGEHCTRASAWQLAVLLTSFILLVIGAGGIRPCNLAFGAEQFNPNTESGKRGITSFFNWYYFTFTFAVMVSVTGIVYVQSDISWPIGLAIPTFLMFISCALFFIGTRLYVIVKPQGSPLTSVAQVITAAIKKRNLKLPQNDDVLFSYVPPNSINSKLAHSTQFKFLDKAAVVSEKDGLRPDGSAADPWSLCSVQQVEEVKCLVRIFPIWASAIMCHVPLIQQQTYAVFQALQLDRNLFNTSFKVPAATYVIFTMITLTIWIPIYDRIIVPSLQKLTKKEGGLTLLQRMGTGIALSVLCMVVSGLVERKRREIALTRPTLGFSEKGGGISAMSGMWLVPQLGLAGLAEGFNYVAQVEFYYKEFPENMRSIAGSAFFMGLAVASYLSGFLVSVVHRVSSGGGGDWLPEDLNAGRLDWFYYLIGGLGVVNFGYFLVCARWYRYKGDVAVGGDGVNMGMENKESDGSVLA